MPKLKVLVPMAGIDVSYSKGDIAEFDDAEAARLIAAGHAEAIEEPEPSEHNHPESKQKGRK